MNVIVQVLIEYTAFKNIIIIIIRCFIGPLCKCILLINVTLFMKDLYANEKMDILLLSSLLYET